MSTDEPTTEQRILKMVKRVLTDVAKDTYTPPNMKHPLTPNTIQGQWGLNRFTKDHNSPNRLAMEFTLPFCKDIPGKDTAGSLPALYPGDARRPGVGNTGGRGRGRH